MFSHISPIATGSREGVYIRGGMLLQGSVSATTITSFLVGRIVSVTAGMITGTDGGEHESYHQNDLCMIEFHGKTPCIAKD